MENPRKERPTEPGKNKTRTRKNIKEIFKRMKPHTTLRLAFWALLMFFLVLFAVSCHTSKKVVEKSKESTESLKLSENHLDFKNDSVISQIKAINEANSIYHILSNLNVKYNGETGDSAEIVVIYTKNEITGPQLKLNIKGKATADFKSDSGFKLNKKDSTGRVNTTLDQTKKLDQNKKDVSKSDTSSTIKNKESKTTGFQFSFWIWVIVISIVVIALWWFFGKPKGSI